MHAYIMLWFSCIIIIIIIINIYIYIHTHIHMYVYVYIGRFARDVCEKPASTVRCDMVLHRAFRARDIFEQCISSYVLV